MDTRHHFTAAPVEDGIAYLCHGCDTPRSGPLAYCDSCEEVTESYTVRADGSVPCADLERAVMAGIDRLIELRRGELELAPTSTYGMGVWA